MSALPYFGDAYMADTRHLTLEEHGAYHLLLLIAWRSPNCALPDDDKRLSQMLGITAKRWSTLKPTIMAFWTPTEHGWQQKRLTKERSWVDEKSRKNRAAATAAHQARAGHLATNSFPAGANSSDHNSNPEEALETANSLKDNEPDAANAPANAAANAPANGYAPPPPPTLEEKTPTSVGAKKNDPRGTRLPGDWQPSPLTGQTAEMVAAWTSGMLERELSKFRDYFAKTPGAKGRSLDWDASYRNWLRNADERKMNPNERAIGKSAAAFAALNYSDDAPF